MELRDIQFIFNRALSRVFCAKKLLSTFLILLLCGIMIVFFRGISLQTGQWIALSLNFLPVFLCAGVLLATGIILTRIYHDEIKKKETSYRKIINNSWDVIIGAGYLAVPVILIYLLLWMLLGVFFLLNDIPGLGHLFSVVLSFGPFLLNLGAIILCVFSISMLFVITPIIALRGINRIQLAQTFAKRFHENLFYNIVLGIIAMVPFWFVFTLLSISAAMTGQICETCGTPLYTIMQWFFVMIPFTAALTPAVIFFFNFAAESHVLLLKAPRRSVGL